MCIALLIRDISHIKTNVDGAVIEVEIVELCFLNYLKDEKSSNLICYTYLDFYQLVILIIFVVLTYLSKTPR